MKIINKKARFDYEIKEVVEAGIQLTGAEVKAAKLGQISMEGAQVKITGDEAWVFNLQIYPYKFADSVDYDPTRKRKLLLNKDEIISLQSKMKAGRLMLVPTAMYTKHNLVKMEIGLARGKRKYEKREVIKKRELERAGEQ